MQVSARPCLRPVTGVTKLRRVAVAAYPIDAAVIVCAYTLDRWSVLAEAIEGVRRQARPPSEIVLVIDGNEELLERASEAFTDICVVANSHNSGSSGARNTGYDVSRASALVFLDDDAVPDLNWLEELVGPLSERDVLGTGGLLTPVWEARRPDWLTDEFLWTVGCSYTGMPTSRSRVRNVISANMAVRRSVFEHTGGFESALSRRATETGEVTGSAEETEFCIRALDRHPGCHWLYIPEARVRHHVPESRITWDYFRARCVLEGRSKAIMVKFTGSRTGLRSERAYVRSVIPRALVRELRGVARGHRRGPPAFAGIIAGVGYTGSAYARARLAAWRRPGDRR